MDNNNTADTGAARQWTDEEGAEIETIGRNLVEVLNQADGQHSQILQAVANVLIGVLDAVEVTDAAQRSGEVQNLCHFLLARYCADAIRAAANEAPRIVVPSTAH